MEFKHPNYYKNLRKLARLRNRDQAISDNDSTESRERAPGTGQQADKPSSSQAGGRVGPKGSSLQAGAQASSGARINKR